MSIIPAQPKIIPISTLIIFMIINIPIFEMKIILIAALIIPIAANIPILLERIILVAANSAIALTAIALSPQNY